MSKSIKKVLAILLAIVTVFSCTMVMSSATTYDANKVVNYALNLVGTSYANGYCLAFVKDIFSKTCGFTSSACCAYKYGSSYIDSSSKSNIPLGADVFFSGSSKTCSTCGHKCGHVGIYVGNGYIVHCWGGKIKKMKIDDVVNAGYPYRGYGWHGNANFSSTASTSSSSTSSALKENTWYTMTNVKANKLLNVYGSKNASNTNVTVYQKDKTSGQDFKLVSHGTMKYNGKTYTKYVIVPRCASSCALNVYGTVSKNDSNVNIWTKSGNSTQDWIIQSVSGNKWVIRSANNTNYVLTASGTSNSSNVKLATYSAGNTYQLWAIA